jgi:hypothetical protein
LFSISRFSWKNPTGSTEENSEMIHGAQSNLDHYQSREAHGMPAINIDTRFSNQEKSCEYHGAQQKERAGRDAEMVK